MFEERRDLDLHGIRVAIDGPREITRLLSARLSALPETTADSIDLRFQFEFAGRAHSLPPPARSGRPVYRSRFGDVLYRDDEDDFYTDAGPHIRMICEPARGVCRYSYLSPDDEQLWLLSHPLFNLPLMEMAKRRGRYPLHAAALEWNGAGLLIGGASGAGKSTLALALLRAGLGFLGDDLVFLSDGRALAFPDEIDFTDDTAALLAAWAALGLGTKRNGFPKRAVAARDVSDSCLVDSTSPAVLVFPEVTGEPRCRLWRISAAEALMALAPNVLLTEARSSQAHLDALGRLARECVCVRLSMGPLEHAAKMILDLL